MSPIKTTCGIYSITTPPHPHPKKKLQIPQYINPQVYIFTTLYTMKLNK